MKTGCIHLIYGPVAAGKSTYAKKLSEQHNAVIFTMDEWMNTLFVDDQQGLPDQHWVMNRAQRCENQMWKMVEQLMFFGQHVVLDIGMWTRQNRQDFIERCDECGHDYDLYFLNADTDVRRERMINRNKDKGETYQFDVSTVMFNTMEILFELPDNEELACSIVINSNK